MSDRGEGLITLGGGRKRKEVDSTSNAKKGTKKPKSHDGNDSREQHRDASSTSGNGTTGGATAVTDDADLNAMDVNLDDFDEEVEEGGGQVSVTGMDVDINLDDFDEEVAEGGMAIGVLPDRPAAGSAGQEAGTRVKIEGAHTANRIDNTHHTVQDHSPDGSDSSDGGTRRRRPSYESTLTPIPGAGGYDTREERNKPYLADARKLIKLYMESGPTVCGEAIKGHLATLRSSYEAPDPHLVGVLRVAAETNAVLYSSPELFDALTFFLRAQPQFQFRLYSAVPFLCAKLLFEALADSPVWDPRLPQILLEDALGERAWCDSRECSPLVTNIATAFGPMPETNGVPTRKGVSNRYPDPDVRHKIKNYAMMEITAAVATRNRVDKQTLLTLGLLAGYPEARDLLISRLDNFLATGTLVEPVQRTLQDFVQHVGQMSSADLANVLTLCGARFRSHHGPLLIDTLSALAQVQPRYSEVVLHHLISVELKAGTPSLSRTLTAMCSRFEDAEHVMAETLLQYLSQKPAHLIDVKRFIRILVRGTPEAVALPALFRGIFTQRPHLAPSDPNANWHWTMAWADMACFLFLVSVPPPLLEPSALQSLRLADVLTSFQKVRSDAIHDAIAWAHESIYNPSLLRCVLHRILFMDGHITYIGETGSDSDRAAYKVLSGPLPLSEDALSRILLIGLGQDPPLTGIEAPEYVRLVWTLVRRGAEAVALRNHQRTGNDCEVKSEQLCQGILRLAMYSPPHGLGANLPLPPNGSSEVPLAVTGAYWRACLCVAVLACYNLQVLADAAWAVPCVRLLLAMLITRRFGPPLPVLDAGQEASAVDADRAAVSALMSRVTPAQLTQPEATFGLPRNRPVAAQIMTVLQDYPRAPPEGVVRELEQIDSHLGLGARLRASRSPDLLMRVIDQVPLTKQAAGNTNASSGDMTREGSSGFSEVASWLLPIVQADAAALDDLPVFCLCEIALTPDAQLSPRDKKTKKLVEKRLSMATKDKLGENEAGWEAFSYFFDKVRSPSVAIRTAAHVCLATLLHDDGGMEGGEGGTVLVDEGSAGGRAGDLKSISPRGAALRRWLDQLFQRLEDLSGDQGTAACDAFILQNLIQAFSGILNVEGESAIVNCVVEHIEAFKPIVREESADRWLVVFGREYAQLVLSRPLLCQQILKSDMAFSLLSAILGRLQLQDVPSRAVSGTSSPDSDLEVVYRGEDDTVVVRAPSVVIDAALALLSLGTQCKLGQDTVPFEVQKIAKLFFAAPASDRSGSAKSVTSWQAFPTYRARPLQVGEKAVPPEHRRPLASPTQVEALVTSRDLTVITAVAPHATVPTLLTTLGGCSRGTGQVQLALLHALARVSSTCSLDAVSIPALVLERVQAVLHIVKLRIDLGSSDVHEVATQVEKWITPHVLRKASDGDGDVTMQMSSSPRRVPQSTKERNRHTITATTVAGKPNDRRRVSTIPLSSRSFDSIIKEAPSSAGTASLVATSNDRNDHAGLYYDNLALREPEVNSDLLQRSGRPSDGSNQPASVELERPTMYRALHQTDAPQRRAIIGSLLSVQGHQQVVQKGSLYAQSALRFLHALRAHPITTHDRQSRLALAETLRYSTAPLFFTPETVAGLVRIIATALLPATATTSSSSSSKSTSGTGDAMETDQVTTGGSQVPSPSADNNLVDCAVSLTIAAMHESPHHTQAALLELRTIQVGHASSAGFTAYVAQVYIAFPFQAVGMLSPTMLSGLKSCGQADAMLHHIIAQLQHSDTASLAYLLYRKLAVTHPELALRHVPALAGLLRGSDALPLDIFAQDPARMHMHALGILDLLRPRVFELEETSEIVGICLASLAKCQFGDKRLFRTVTRLADFLCHYLAEFPDDTWDLVSAQRAHILETLSLHFQRSSKLRLVLSLLPDATGHGNAKRQTARALAELPVSPTELQGLKAGLDAGNIPRKSVSGVQWRGIETHLQRLSDRARTTPVILPLVAKELSRLLASRYVPVRTLAYQLVLKMLHTSPAAGDSIIDAYIDCLTSRDKGVSQTALTHTSDFYHFFPDHAKHFADLLFRLGCTSPTADVRQLAREELNNFLRTTVQY